MTTQSQTLQKFDAYNEAKKLALLSNRDLILIWHMYNQQERNAIISFLSEFKK